MKKTKMSLANIQGKLSRTEMKNIMAGSGENCSSGPCTVYDSNSNATYPGNCGLYDVGGGLYVCECKTSFGFYDPKGGTSHCYI
jgi:hypothetical protein